MKWKHSIREKFKEKGKIATFFSQNYLCPYKLQHNPFVPPKTASFAPPEEETLAESYCYVSSKR